MAHFRIMGTISFFLMKFDLLQVHETCNCQVRPNRSVNVPAGILYPSNSSGISAAVPCRCFDSTLIAGVIFASSSLYFNLVCILLILGRNTRPIQLLLLSQLPGRHTIFVCRHALVRLVCFQKPLCASCLHA